MYNKVNFLLLMTMLWSRSRGYDSFDYEYSPHDTGNTAPAHTRTNVTPGQGPSQYQNSTVHKCRCEGQQVWRDSRCHDHNTSVVVQDPATGRVQTVATSQFGHVEVGLPQCSSGHLRTTLVDPGYGSHDQFSLVASGALLWQQRQYDQYCIEHTWNVELQQLSWQAQLCLAPPQVPRCCVDGRALAADGSCSGTDARLFSPPVRVNEVKEHWQSEAVEQVVDVTCDAQQELLMVPLDDEWAWLTYEAGNATLVHQSAPLQQRHISHNYCIAFQVGKEEYFTQFCHTNYSKLCQRSTCVRKCCLENNMMIDYKCGIPMNENDLWKPLFYDADDLTPGATPPQDLQITHGEPICPSYYYLIDPDNTKLLNNGSIIVQHDIAAVSYPVPEYCVDNFRESNGDVHTQALLCFPTNPPAPPCQVAVKYLYPILLLVSCLFLGATLVTYASIPEERNKLNGRLLISLVSALLTGYLLMAASSLASQVGPINATACRIMASVMHFSFLAAFFWLNVMCFDMWRTLRTMRVAGDSKNRRRFLVYSLYAWGCPLLITAVASIIEQLPESNADVIRPDYSTKSCFFQHKDSIWLYFYMFVLTLTLADTVFFGLVARLIYRSQNNKHLQDTRDRNKDRLWLYVKLFLVMGVTWLAEVVSFQAGSSCYGWVVTDIINALQGFFIFLVFICKKQMLAKVKDRWLRCCCHTKDLIDSTASNITSSFYTGSSHSSSNPRVKNSTVRSDPRQDGPESIPLRTSPP